MEHSLAPNASLLVRTWDQSITERVLSFARPYGGALVPRRRNVRTGAARRRGVT